MIETIVRVDGMMCGMCESHINDAIRQAFPVKKVTSSHTKGETVILADQAIPKSQLAPVIEKTGYQLTEVNCVPYEKKKGLLSRIFG